MKIKKGFVLRELAGEKIITGEGIEQIDFNKIVTLNDSAAYIWESIEGKDFDVSFVVDLLVSRYDVERKTAEFDAQSLLDNWEKIGLIG